MATNTAGGPTPGNTPDQLTVSLTVAKGGVAYGPITETWSVAPAHLAGTVYYNSYGTALVKNSNDNDATGHQYGAAVLAIKGGATAPVVIAGNDTPGNYSGAGCRVCHVVAGNGNLLIAQHGDSLPADLIVRPQERERRDGAHRRQQHLRLGGALHRRLAGAHQHRAARGRAAGDEPALRLPARGRAGDAARR